MTRLVTNLLNMVRVETGALAVQKAWQPLEEALGVALLRLEERLSAHPVTVGLPRDLPLVPIDELLIEQVFINLLENAVEYTPPGTRISVGAWPARGRGPRPGGGRGPGIPAGEEEAVFVSSTGPAADTGGGRRSGLGLTISRGIVAAHGGRIWVEPGRAGARPSVSPSPLTALRSPALPADPADTGAA